MRLFQSAVITAWPFERPVTTRHLGRQALAAAFAASLIGTPISAYPLGLGKIVGEPVLGEVLRLEIPLIGSITQSLDDECVSVRRPAEPLDEDYLPRDLIARVDKQSGTTRLLLTTRSALHQPLVEFRIAITCGYNLSTDYLLAASPPNDGRAAAVGRPASSVTTGPTFAVESPVGALPESGQGMPDGMAAKAFVVDQPITLQQLARQHFPGPLRQERFIRWVAEANPEILRGVANLGQHRLMPGVRLLLPSGVPPRRPGDHQNLAAATASTGADAGPAAAGKQMATPATTAKTGGNGRRDRLVVGVGSGRDLRETIALVERLTGMAEQQMAAQSANNEKIQALEAALAELNKHVLEIEASAHQRETRLQAETAAVKMTLEEQTEQSWWQLLVAVVAGGLLGAALMLVVRLFLARAPAHRLDSFALDAVPAHAADSDSPHTILDAPLDFQVTADGVVATNTTGGRAGPAPGGANEAHAPAKATASHRSPAEPVEFRPPVSRPEQAPPEVSPQASSGTPTQAASDPATAAIELANIMASMGLAESAAQTLVEHIRENPRQSLHHWLKLLDLHRLNGSRDEFERSTEELRHHFNVRADEWESGGASQRSSLENYAHIRSKLIELWPTPDCVQFLQSLLMDNREGTRAGFPLPVAEEILLLIAIQSNT